MALAFNTITSAILDAAIAVHKELGPGLLESIYQECLVLELAERGLKAEQSVSIPLQYRGEFLDKHFAIDILVEDSVVLELKAVEKLLPVHEAQLISYLRLANKRVGLLINFNEKLLKDGFKRFVNKLRE